MNKISHSKPFFYIMHVLNICTFTTLYIINLLCPGNSFAKIALVYIYMESEEIVEQWS